MGALIFLILGTSIASFCAAGCGIMISILLSKRGCFLIMHLLIAVALVGMLIILSTGIQSTPSWTDIGQQLKVLSSGDDGQVSLHLHGRVSLWEHYFGATRPCGPTGIGGCDAFMKLCLSSSGCESRPAKGEPARVGSKPCASSRNGVGDA